MTLLIVLIVLVFLLPVGGSYYNDGVYQRGGYGVGLVLAVLLVVLLLTHRLRA